MNAGRAGAAAGVGHAGYGGGGGGGRGRRKSKGADQEQDMHEELVRHFEVFLLLFLLLIQKPSFKTWSKSGH